MPLNLRNNLSFCRVAGRVVFLDLAADRYFCLSETAERRFVQLLEGTEGGGHDGLISFTAAGILVECDGGTGLAPPAVMEPKSSFLDEPLPPASAMSSVMAVARLAEGRTRLKVVGLRRTIAAMSRRKAALASEASDVSDTIRSVIAPFERAARLVTSLDDCLGRSLSIANALISQNIRPDVIIGVRLGPFNAHCWVQHGDRVVNDRVDMVRMFTPILKI